MCGILFELRCADKSVLKDEQVMQRMRNRGPDCTDVIELDIGTGMTLAFCGAVLRMRGDRVISQPLVNERGILLFNGDIFDESWDLKINDTIRIMEKLQMSLTDSSETCIKELNCLKGPFSIIYYDKITENLYFTRDKIGRNSLLFYRNKDLTVISSVLGRKYNCIEVPATHIHKWDIKTNQVKLFPWDNLSSRVEELSIDEWLTNIQNLQSLPDDKFVFEFDNSSLTQDYEEDIVEVIKNISVKVKDHNLLLKSLIEITTLCDIMLNVTNLLEKSVKIRLQAQPMKCNSCINKIGNCNHCAVGILFSGGLDCTILAILADKYIPKHQSIELLNVAFTKDDLGTYEVPDRLTGRQSFEELKSLCPLRRWLLKEINISRRELEEYQHSTIADLVHPRQTILDESLGSALWFAARADNDATSNCRILLIGSGADELFGGYTRHRNAYKRHGWQGLNKELQLDWMRIAFRNLARDNRVICDHGRQPRMPYLDEEFASYVLSLKPWLKCFPTEHLGQGVGDKLMLRLVACHLGLKEVATFPKRALQFGSRIANKKEKGSDISKTFININV